MWEQQGRGYRVRATWDWLDAMCHLRIFVEEGAPELARTISHIPCPTEYTITAHGLAMGITPPPCFALDVTMLPGSTLSRCCPTLLRMLLSLLALLRISLPPLALQRTLLPPSGFVKDIGAPSGYALDFTPAVAAGWPSLHSHAPPWTTHHPLAMCKRSCCLITWWSDISTGCPGLTRLHFAFPELYFKGGGRSVMVVPVKVVLH